jgi:hypothetical protein
MLDDAYDDMIILLISLGLLRLPSATVPKLSSGTTDGCTVELMDIAPDCFRLAWRKNISVQQALNGRKWMRGLRRILFGSIGL